MSIEDLKIELRAVPYGSHSDWRALEYRISPRQDLVYYDDVSLFFGLIKFQKKRKYSTKWFRITIFECNSTSKYHEEEHYLNYMPIFCNTQEELDKYKKEFTTYGELEDYVYNFSIKEREKYRVQREEYLKEKQKILY